MNANTLGKQFLRQMVGAPGVSDILVLLARNRWVMPHALRLRLKAQLRVREAIVSAPLPDGALVKLWHDSWDSWGNSVTSLHGFVMANLCQCRRFGRTLNIAIQISTSQSTCNNSGGVFWKCRFKY